MDVGAGIDSVVGAGMGVDVGAAVGGAVGNGVGAGTGLALMLGATDGALVGTPVGAAVDVGGAVVGVGVGGQLHHSEGGVSTPLESGTELDLHLPRTQYTTAFARLDASSRASATLSTHAPGEPISTGSSHHRSRGVAERFA